MLVASAGSSLFSCDNASPTISKLRSTARRNRRSARYACSDLPAVNPATSSAASRMSSSSLRASGVIDYVHVPLRDCKEARVRAGGYANEIDLPVQQIFEAEQHAEVLAGQ